MKTRRLLFPALLALFVSLPALAGVNRWTPIGPWGGSVRAVAVHPTIPRIVYAATADGVFKSVNRGRSWTSTSPRFGDWGRQADTVLLAPSAPSTLYVQTLGRIFRSTDAGATWHPTSSDLPSPYPTGLAVDPSSSSTLWAGSFSQTRGIFKSLDGGATWSLVSALSYSTVEVFAFAPGAIFAGLSGFTGQSKGIVRSLDGGATWQPANNGLDLPADGLVNTWVTAAPDAPGTLYAAVVSNPFLTPSVAVFRSRDGGDTWEPSGPGGYPIAAGRAGAVYTGSGARSLDFGETWSTPAAPKGQVLALAADPLAPGLAWAGTDYRGLFKTVDGGGSWQTAHTGITAAQTAGLAIDPSHPSILYAGLLGGGLFKTVQGGLGGTLWQELDPGLPDPDLFSTFSALAVDPLDPDNVYTATDEGRTLLASQDGGAAWRVMASPGVGDRVLELTPDPGATGVLYAAGVSPAPCGSFKTVNAGASWSCLPIGSSYQIAVDPRNPANVYAANDLVAKSGNRGNTWRITRRGLPNSAPTTSIAISPSVPGTLYLGTWKGVYKSTDGAQTWRSSGVGLPRNTVVVALAVDPRTPATAWAAVQDNGVYRTTDGGAHWRPINLGLPLRGVKLLALDPADPTTAYAGVEYVGGVYKITVR